MECTCLVDHPLLRENQVHLRTKKSFSELEGRSVCAVLLSFMVAHNANNGAKLSTENITIFQVSIPTRTARAFTINFISYVTTPNLF